MGRRKERERDEEERSRRGAGGRTGSRHSQTFLILMKEKREKEAREKEAYLQSLVPENERRRGEKFKDKEERRKAAKEKRKRVYNRSEDTNWQSSFNSFTEQLRAIGLSIKDVAGDGNCLFRSIGDQIFNDPDMHAHVRKTIVDYIEAHREDFEPFIEDDEPFEKYVKSMRKNTIWGGNIELQSASLVFGVNIHIYQLAAPRWSVTNFTDEGHKFISLSYHDGDHYNSVHPIKGFAPPQVVVKPLTSISTDDINKKEKNITKPSELEKIIIHTTGVSDVKLVREMLQANQGDVNLTIDTLMFAQAAEFDTGEIPLDTSYEEYIDPSRAIVINNFVGETSDIPEDVMEAIKASEVAMEAEKLEKQQNGKYEKDGDNEKDKSDEEGETKEERAQRLLKKS